MSTLVIADCGSTKSDWRIIRDSAENVSVSLPGINPALQDRDSVLERLSLLRGAVGADMMRKSPCRIPPLAVS